AGVLPLAWLWLAITTGFPSGFIVLGVIFLAIVGWILPMLILDRRARERTEAIDYELPELIDLLVVTLEAGLSFLASLQMAADRLEGPLGVELRLTLQEQRMGLSTNEALKGMLERTDTPGCEPSYGRSFRASRSALRPVRSCGTSPLRCASADAPPQ